MSPKSPVLLTLAISLALTACSQTPPRSDTATSTVQIAPTASSSTRTPVQAAWWQRFNDPLMTALIQETLQASPDIKTAQASLRAARAQRTIAGASLLPTLNIGGSARRSGGNDSYGASLDASWEADIFGGNRLASSAAEADVQATQASLEDVKASLAAEVASSYVNLRLAQARLSVARQSLAARQETVRLITLKQQAGLASALEVEQANLSLGQSQAQIPALESSITQNQHALATLTGKEPQALQSRLAAAKPVPVVAVQVAATIPANAIRQRPDIRAAEYKVQAASLRVGEAKANLYPSFNLGGSLSASSVSVGDLFDPANVARSLLASISAPLFDGGKLKQQVESRDAAREQAVASYQKAVLTALRDVANAFASLQANRQQQPVLQNNVTLARSAEKLAQLSYDAGTADFQNVLDAQRSVLSAQESLLAAQVDNTQAVISLYKAIGGAW
ncbi:MAG TPA: efflux transporter outer membrane subunit [Candidatus Thiothrix moscowensis]|uniref:efflux transporter outer membrane subunit n=1 Tax=unclassified Thiothrix TaxID=2636184 RepID=UPI0025F39574|nr:MULTISPECIES: efflux transporter outer membrane subunit [unclassified Thiothrix]HRJ53888.1 efflux transporter outer membrane subunit [Candidatus Thiothrix moscowensis]HRJ93970.1 efflux transporter outer membrane subunit [Candidatus Thiothrix moscowensis]